MLARRLIEPRYRITDFNHARVFNCTSLPLDRVISYHFLRLVSVDVHAMHGMAYSAPVLIIPL